LLPGGVYTKGPELHLDVSALQRSVLLLEVSTQEGPELEVSTLQVPELQLDVSALQMSVQYCSWRCLPKRPELILDVSALQRSVLLLEVSTLQGHELHLDVSALQRSVLLLSLCLYVCL
jgi:hypothetical protein